MANDQVKPHAEISLSLHPDMLTPHKEHLEVEGSLGHPIYTQARESLAGMHNALAAMIETRAAVMRTVNPHDPNAPRVMAHADKNTGKGAGIQLLSGREDDLREAMSVALDRAAKDFDRRFATIRATREALAKRIDDALVDPKGSTPAGIATAGEIRAYARSLKDHERHKFVEEAIEAGDLQTLSALLNAPRYLSGLTDQRRALYRDSAAEKFAGQDFKQLAAADKVVDHLMTASSVMLKKFGELLPPKRETPQSAADEALSNLKKGVAR
jgi:hypothetical protein